MCTVTLCYQGNQDFIITTNRDEAPQRKSIHPKIYDEGIVNMLYPKDELAGGTWIGLSDKKRMICLLNGGFKGHIRKPEYRHSRGLIVKALLASNDLEVSINNYNFNKIEPFTIVAVDWNKSIKFFELVWDGTETHFKEIPLKTHIWSSTTLYTDNMKRERHQWFWEFISENDPNSDSILNFHSRPSKNKEYGIIMDRGYVKTTSITQVIKNNDLLEMSFINLETKKRSLTNFNIPKATYE